MDNSITEKLYRVIDAKKEEIAAFGEKIYKNPETGFKEFETAKATANKLNEAGIKFEALKCIPGVRATLDTGKEGPGVAVLGEMDAVICSSHPHCNVSTGAVHACGHNIQLAAMIGAAVGIMDSGILGELSGKIHFIAVPAEEFIEMEYRKSLKDRGIIKYLGGKAELLRQGFFDDVDICIMIHSRPDGRKISIESSSNGFLVKKIKYTGRASHAGGAPHEGINALYAANLGLMAINSVRETFRDEDFIRVHPIITKGGEIVNAIPADVRVETLVRGKSMDAILDAARKVDRALAGGACALGAEVEIENMPGYFPLIVDKKLASITLRLAQELTGEDDVPTLGHSAISTDLGDLAALMPVIEISTGGVTGGLHSADFRNIDPDVSYLLSAKILAGLAASLLCDKSALAKEVLSDYHPQFKSKREYFDFVDRLFSTTTGCCRMNRPDAT